MTWAAASVLSEAFGEPTADSAHAQVSAAGSSPDSLNALAKARGLAFGSALGMGCKGQPQVPSLAPFLSRPPTYTDPQMRALFLSQCGILVPENELKLYTLRPDAKTFDFERADLLIEFCHQHSLAMRGHTLLWNRTKWIPEWINAYDFGSRPATTAERMLREHIGAVCRRYGNRVFSYDVINESIAPATGELEASPFTKVLGADVVDICFHAAREAAPNAELVYNDYMSWSRTGDVHRSGVLKILERMRKNNVPVDVLGIQSHVGSDGLGGSTGLLGDADLIAWRKFLDEVTKIGLGLAITEFDVDDQSVSGTIAERDQIVADNGKAYLDIMLSYRELRYVMAWGIVDKFSWLQRRAPRADGLPKRCTPYDDDFQSKPLRQAMVRSFSAAPFRPARIIKTA
ncbi:MAG: endo-1,4-beta-xylanase [Rhizomicrobium sp.]|nr:endo-1,4-beta-xylanase [Rhizomicrobium sp.]